MRSDSFTIGLSSTIGTSNIDIAVSSSGIGEGKGEGEREE